LLPPNHDPLIGRWIVGGIPKPTDPTKPVPKIKVFVKLNIHGVVTVSSAQHLEEYIVEEPVEEPKSNTTPKDGDKKDGDKKDGDKKEGDKVPMEEDPADKDKEKPKTKKKKKIRRTDLKIDTVAVGSLADSQLKAFTEKEAQMANQDRIVEETGEAKNSLESYCLEMRNKVQDEKDLAPYVTEKVRDQFIEALGKEEEWLNDEGYDSQKSEYVARLDRLRKIGDPIINRKREELARPERISTLKSAIGRYSNFAASKDEKWAHIEDADRKKVLKLATDTDQWLATALSKQDRVAKHDDPVLTVKQLSDKLHELETGSDPIVNKPKPKPKEEPKKEEPKAEDTKKDQEKKGDEKAKPNSSSNSTEKEKEKEQANKKAKTDKDPKSPTGQAKMDTS
jgi:heat shock protein 4